MVGKRSDSPRPIQEEIESVMRQFCKEERWESIYLFSAEGLPMAGQGKSPGYSEDKLLEFAFSFIESIRLLGNEHKTKEIVLSGTMKRNLVFRYFDAWEEPVIMAAVLTGKKGYKRALRKLVRLIQSLP